ncbi:MAG: T9SS type A sorting domain-containing protein, partial [Bacteroidetes bacterium]|nr:T9SS type A sorting domain-containing protein [Bacteroidota bacterium]
PASGNSQIDFSVGASSSVSIQLFDVTGRRIKTIFNNDVQAGKHTAEFSGLDKFADGSYFYKMEVKQNNKIVFSETKRLMIVK